mmetsp:Transcript_1187/g.2096  ORF Transcript_1187/g.2096 Transcript_1187/m.2096 type:complete len:141 (-) Transcript_1187:1237-1659(-)
MTNGEMFYFYSFDTPNGSLLIFKNEASLDIRHDNKAANTQKNIDRIAIFPNLLMLHDACNAASGSSFSISLRSAVQRSVRSTRKTKLLQMADAIKEHVRKSHVRRPRLRHVEAQTMANEMLPKIIPKSENALDATMYPSG